MPLVRCRFRARQPPAEDDRVCHLSAGKTIPPGPSVSPPLRWVRSEVCTGRWKTRWKMCKLSIPSALLPGGKRYRFHIDPGRISLFPVAFIPFLSASRVYGTQSQGNPAVWILTDSISFSGTHSSTKDPQLPDPAACSRVPFRSWSGIGNWMYFRANVLLRTGEIPGRGDSASPLRPVRPGQRQNNTASLRAERSGEVRFFRVPK